MAAGRRATRRAALRWLGTNQTVAREVGDRTEDQRYQLGLEGFLRLPPWPCNNLFRLGAPPEQACLILRNSTEVMRRHTTSAWSKTGPRSMPWPASSKLMSSVQQLCSKIFTKPA